MYFREVNPFIYNEEVRKRKRAELGVEDKFVIGHVERRLHLNLAEESFQLFLDQMFLLILRRQMRMPFWMI